MLAKTGSCNSEHHRNIQNLEIELFKASSNLHSQIMNERFYFREVNYNIRTQTYSATVKTKTAKGAMNSLNFLQLLWEICYVANLNVSTVLVHLKLVSSIFFILPKERKHFKN